MDGVCMSPVLCVFFGHEMESINSNEPLSEKRHHLFLSVLAFPDSPVFHVLYEAFVVVRLEHDNLVACGLIFVIH